MLSSASIADEFKNRVLAVFPTLDPVVLLQEMERLQTEFWRTAVGVTHSENTSQDPVQRVLEDKATQSNLEERATTPTPPPRAEKLARKSKAVSEPRIECITIFEMPMTDFEAKKDVTVDEFDFVELTEQFFNKHLRKCSPNTVASYRDTFRLLQQFAEKHLNKATQLTLQQFDVTLISAFLDYLETCRGLSTGSRNLRLSAIRSFCRFVAISKQDQSDRLDEILAIPSKECMKNEIHFLTRQEVEALLATTKKTTWFDRRNRALLTLALDTGMLVSELTALQPQDVDFERAQVRIVGRRRKERFMPLSESTLAVLKSWLQEPAKSKRKILFQNPSGRSLTTSGVSNILKRHIAAASQICPSLKDKKVTLYWLRHTKVLELLQAGVTRSQISRWLGMESAVFTNIYDNAFLAWQKISTKEPSHKSK
jgi:site-specific recombinase XerD